MSQQGHSSLFEWRTNYKPMHRVHSNWRLRLYSLILNYDFSGCSLLFFLLLASLAVVTCRLICFADPLDSLGRLVVSIASLILLIRWGTTLSHLLSWLSWFAGVTRRPTCFVDSLDSLGRLVVSLASLILLIRWGTMLFHLLSWLSWFAGVTRRPTCFVDSLDSLGHYAVSLA